MPSTPEDPHREESRYQRHADRYQSVRRSFRIDAKPRPCLGRCLEEYRSGRGAIVARRRTLVLPPRGAGDCEACIILGALPRPESLPGPGSRPLAREMRSRSCRRSKPTAFGQRGWIVPGSLRRGGRHVRSMILGLGAQPAEGVLGLHVSDRALDGLRCRARFLSHRLHDRRAGRRVRRLGARLGCRHGRVGVDDRARCFRLGFHADRGSRKQTQRVDVTVGIRRDPDAEMDMGVWHVRLAARSHRSDRISLGHDDASRDAHGSELLKGDRVAVGRSNRERPAATWHPAGETHRSTCGRTHRATHRAADVDPSVLPSLVGILSDGKLLQHRPIDGPGPGERGHSADQERDDDREQDDEPCHVLPPCCLY